MFNSSGWISDLLPPIILGKIQNYNSLQQLDDNQTITNARDPA